MSQNSVRIVLVGKTGVGKSASGNTILGEKMFTSSNKQCKSGKKMINCREVLVVNTPGLYNTSMSNDEVVQEIKKSITYAAPGPHVFLLVLSFGRFTEEEQNTVELIQKAFGTEANKHMMVLFTMEDDVEESKVKQFIANNPQLNKLIEACESEYHTFNNREKDRTQVTRLVDKINLMKSHNRNSYYKN